GGHATQAAVLFAQGAARRDGVAHDCVAERLDRQAHERARALLALCQEARLPERRRVARYVRLRLAQKLTQLAQREPFPAGQCQEAQPKGVAQQPIKLPAGVETRRGGVHGQTLAYFRIFATNNKTREISGLRTQNWAHAPARPAPCPALAARTSKRFA